MASSADAGPPKAMKHGKQDFELGQLLGDGGYAKVVEGTIINKDSPQFGEKYAIKVMDKRHIVKSKKHKYVAIEKQVFLATAPHPFICHLHFTFQDSYSLFFVLDLCNDAELSYQIWKYCGLSESVTQFYLSEVVSCLRYMHSKGIYHRDIKPENILLHSDGHIRLTDFGTAKIQPPSDENAAATAATQKSETATEEKQENDDADNANNEDEDDETKQTLARRRSGSFVGTAQYVPPELLNKDTAVSYAGMDFWALGILIYQCLANTTPFLAPTEYLTFKKILEHSYDMPDDVLSANAQQIIDAFLTKELSQRLGMNGFDEIEQHPFFESVTSWEWSDLQKRQAPEYPSTPKHSPIHDEEKRKELRSESVYEGGDDDGAVMELDLHANNDGAAAAQKQMHDKQDSSLSVLYERWQKFLESDEEITLGTTVEKSKYFGMSSEKSVMLLTTHQRILLIDPIKMEIRKNGVIAKSTIVSCIVVDQETFELQFVKTKMKFKCSGPKAQKW
eukprot:CAMPEP_0202691356 /NCGR_PEP_ID=MMETSP1385-20130828/6092_1 /ASSEMBLY_ACC=CAM_ASM_000861 /TAXON_ID=933848 /ORGANISM="Elphidium margaritaceum" /LENGTH=505 /DNA_ID=CAMNT_0049346751 /DNA_START=27 /DNA_END=1541 /DNA_ORIENTATION=-